jgi:hypothetical protein
MVSYLKAQISESFPVLINVARKFSWTRKCFKIAKGVLKKVCFFIYSETTFFITAYEKRWYVLLGIVYLVLTGETDAHECDGINRRNIIKMT